MDFDKVLEKCGNFNRFQLILLSIFAFINFMVSMHYFSQTIISFVPEHWCYHDKLENMTFEEIRDVYSHLKDPSCTKLEDVVDGKGIASTNICDEWIYNLEYGYQSMTAELNWVCDSAFKSTVGQSMFFVGSMSGTLIYGIISDKFGRLPAIVISNLSGVIGDFITSFTRTATTFGICRFVSGLAADTNYYLMYILVMEYLHPSMRTFGLNLCAGIFYSAGLVVAPWLAVWMGDWKSYLTLASLPLSMVMLIYFVLPESAQWLVTRRNYTGAVASLKKVARINGRAVSDDVYKEFVDYYRKDVGTGVNSDNFIGMFKTPRLRKLTFILFFKSMVITLCYDVVSRNIEGMGLSPFIMFSIGSLAVLPSSITMILLQDRIGRKGMSSSSLLFGSIFTTATGVIIAYHKEYQDAILLAAMIFIARYSVSISYESSAQYATELIPTAVRGQGVGAVHLAGFATTVLSPYIIYLAKFMKPLPSLVLSVLLLAGSYCCLLLPETLNKQLPNSLEDGENFGCNEKIFDFPCMQRKVSEADVNKETINSK